MIKRARIMRIIRRSFEVSVKQDLMPDIISFKRVILDKFLKLFLTRSPNSLEITEISIVISFGRIRDQKK